MLPMFLWLSTRAYIYLDHFYHFNHASKSLPHSIHPNVAFRTHYRESPQTRSAPFISRFKHSPLTHTSVPHCPSARTAIVKHAKLSTPTNRLRLLLHSISSLTKVSEGRHE